MSVTVSYLIVAGGGGGGSAGGSSNGAGGGGAGGMRTGTASIADGSYPIVVGDGGLGGNSSSVGVDGSNGGDSSFNGTTSIGGGGGRATTAAGLDGGSGGGGYNAQVGGNGTGGQGNNGGTGSSSSPNFPGGGGGGAGGTGAAATGTAGGNGGAGSASSISGSSLDYAGGGGGGSYNGGTAGTGGSGVGGAGNAGGGAGSNATANRGGGGGGAAGGSIGGLGGNGAAGVVVLSYPTGSFTSATGGTITTSGGNTIHTFTSNGTFVAVTSTLQALSATQGQTATLGRSKTFVQALSTTQGQTATLARLRALLKSLAATQAQSASIASAFVPVISAAVPASDRTTGGATVILLGSNFQNGATITVGGAAATGVAFVSSSKLTFVVPAHAAGASDIVITNPDTSNGTLLSGFMYYTPNADLNALVVDFSGIDPRILRESLKVSRSASLESATFEIPSEGSRPIPFTPVKFGIGSLADNDLIFRGKQEETAQLRKEIAANPWWIGTAAGSDQEFNRYLVWGTYTSVPADEVALDILSKFAPDFTGANIVAALPEITAIFEGVTMDSAFNTLATLIGGYYYRDAAYDIHLFVTETPALVPDALTATTATLLNDPPLTWRANVRQTRNRIIGVGAPTTILSALDQGETIIPIKDAIFDNAPNTALIGAQRVAYQSTVVGGGGTIVGPGAAPSAAPGAALAVGTGVDLGDHGYGYTFVTAAGETIASPVTHVTHNTYVGPIVDPPTGPTVSAPLAGGNGPDPGAHFYAFTELDGSGGESLPSPLSSALNAYDVVAPSASGGFRNTSINCSVGVGNPAPVTCASAHDLRTGDYVRLGNTFVDGVWQVTVTDATHFTIPANVGVGSSGLFTVQYATAYAPDDVIDIVLTYINASGESPYALATGLSIPSVPASPFSYEVTGFMASTDPTVTERRAYLRVNGGTWHWNAVTTDNFLLQTTPTTTGSPPGSNTAYVRQEVITVPIGQLGTVTRRIYRTTAGGSQLKLAGAIANNTATTFFDNVVDASLGSNVPTSNTTSITINYKQSTLSGIAIGPSGTTQRKVYRTVAGGTQLKLLATLANNTTTTYPDSTADSSLGANAPSTDTSNLTSGAGQVLAGATSMPTAGLGPLPTAGWIVAAGQVIRYSGVSGNNLTGIPTTGNGAVTSTILYGVSIVGASLLVGVPASGVGSFGTLVPANVLASLYCERNDVVSQNAIKLIEGGKSTGIYEFKIDDSSINTQTSLNARCDADLLLYASVDGIITVTYTSFDKKSGYGKLVSINRPADGLVGDFLIQTVDIDAIGQADGTPPRYTCTASSVKYSLEDLLRHVVTSS